MHEAFRENEWRVLSVGAAGPAADPSFMDTLTGLRLDRRSGFDWRPAQGRVLRAADQVVLATTGRGLDILMTGVQPHPSDRRD
ncbi:hypothetical protein [Streptomyces lucensis]|uniref:hypothetical protein n=1 Tax=Streptomyces lucensis TaxID=67319 RepID=UPI0016738919|nr:hypothetical protein [Streptomyces lucensis]